MSARFVITKALGSLATLAFVVVFNFFLFRVVGDRPGRDPVPRPQPDRRAARRADGASSGSTAPSSSSSGRYLKQTAQLNFGRSYVTNEPVIDEIADKAPATIALVGVSAVLSAVFGILIGIVAAWRRSSKTDYAATTFTMTTYSMPDFWLGMLLLTVFAVTLGWFPVGGIVRTRPRPRPASRMLLDQAHHMFLPALTLTLAYLGEYALVMRSSLLDTMREDYLVLARAKGLRDVVVRNRHAVPNALLPVVTLIAINFGFVLSGAIAVETIFSWPGLGLATLRGAPGARPADAAGPVPRLQRRGDPVQPDRRPALRRARPAGADA